MTLDLGGQVKTDAFGDAINKELPVQFLWDEEWHLIWHYTGGELCLENIGV